MKSINGLRHTNKIIDIDVTYLSSEKKLQLQEELVKLEEKKDHFLEELENDYKDVNILNTDYWETMDDLEIIKDRINQIKEVLKSSILLEERNSSTIGLGSTVHIQNQLTEGQYIIVDEWEANPQERKISHKSPLGQALLGKQKGESISFEAPAGLVDYKILNIS